MRPRVETKTTARPKVRFSLRTLFLAVTALCCLFAILPYANPFSVRGQFFWTTGFCLPRSAEIVDYRDNYGHSFNGDGSRLLVADVGVGCARNWLNQRPPWTSKWEYGDPPIVTDDLSPWLDKSSHEGKMWYDVLYRGEGDSNLTLFLVNDDGKVYLLGYDS